MSAKDTLDRFDAEWARHLEWRAGKTMSLGDKAEPGRYQVDNRGSGLNLYLAEMPSSLRDHVAKEIEAIITYAVDERHKQQRSKLAFQATREARETLKELGEALALEPIGGDAP